VHGWVNTANVVGGGRGISWGPGKRDKRERAMSSDATARPESHRPAQAEPCEAKLYEAPAGLTVAHGSGFTFLKPQAGAQARARVAE